MTFSTSLQRNASCFAGRLSARWLAIIVWGVLVPGYAAAQGRDRQLMELRVAPIIGGKVRIQGGPSIEITHDGTMNDQLFGVQQWDAICNTRRGATVNIDTQFAFKNGPSRRDARLEISIARSDPGAGWVVTNALAETDYSNGNQSALVSAESSRPGDCTFDLKVTFITGSLTTLRAGRYFTLVQGTISAN